MSFFIPQLFAFERDKYRDTRQHGCLVHLEIISEKIWIHRDGLEDGIASDLARAGIPKSDIVLAFHLPDVLQFTEFAVS